MTNFQIDKEFKEYIPELTADEYKQLESNILEHGIQDPIKVWNNIIIDGHNRYNISKSNGGLDFNFIDMTDKFPDRQSVLDWIILNQIGRRNLNKDQISLYRGLLYNSEKGKQGGKREKANGQNVRLPVSEDLANKFKVSEKTIRRDAKDVETLKDNDLFNDVKDGKITKAKALKEIKQKNIKTFEVPKVSGVYDVIYIDPPWKYEFSKSSNREIENHYPTMSLEELKQLKIPAAENSVMLMWATAPKLMEAMELLQTWGFNYKTNMAWDKETIGMGYWARGQHELLLIATKGEFAAPAPENRYSSVYREQKTKHSKKPNYYYYMIEKMFPGMSLLEMFARQKVNDNWNVWGNQIEGTVENEN